MKPLSDKTVLVTGSTRGIGRAAAFRFAERGARVVVTGRSDESVQATVALLQELHPEGEFFGSVLDLASPPSIEALFTAIDVRFGAVDILVNNGAIGYRTPLLEVTPEVWDLFFATNVRGAFFCAQATMRRLIAAGRPGVILNLSSLGGVRSTDKFPGMTPYVATKFAIAGLTEALASEGKAHGIRVNAVAPGAVNTEMLRTAAPDLKTNTQPEDIADLLVSLCEPGSRALTGAILEIYSNL